jgi:DNA-directed RNA polymerase subunit RPC12/RpoP
MFKCLNPECGRKILILGRLSVEKKATNQYTPDITRTILDSPCCPYCGSKEFEEVPV